jgi:hypothetical protein
MKFQTNGQLSPFTRGELEAMRNHAENDRLLFPLLRWTETSPRGLAYA